jgi:hypothetical protein
MLAPSSLIDQLLASAPGATRPVVEFQLLQTVRDFVVDTELWVEELAPLDLEVGQAEYVPIAPDVGIEVHEVLRVVADGVPVPRIDRTAGLEPFAQGWEWRPDRVIVLHPPSVIAKNQALQITAVLVPTALDVAVPGLERWTEALVAGTLGRLWSVVPQLRSAAGARDLLGVHLQRYNRDRIRAKVEAAGLTKVAGRTAWGGWL